MIKIKVENLTKKYSEVEVIKGLTFEVNEAELVTLLGPSGCGKTTTLRMIAGLIKPDRGRILIDGKDVSPIPTHKRNIGFVFQQAALFPHMNVQQNLEFGLRMRKVPRRERKLAVQHILELVHMQGFEKRKPLELSGGERQRIALASVIVTEPSLLLLDEPLASLDAKIRVELREELRELQQETKKTMIYVTHDQATAFAISDRIFLMRNGIIEQAGTPAELYMQPQTPFAASFIGSSNCFVAKIKEVSTNYLTVRIQQYEVNLNYKLNDTAIGEDVLIYVRPEDIVISPSNKNEGFVLEGEIVGTVFLGELAAIKVQIGENVVNVVIRDDTRFTAANHYIPGQKVKLLFQRYTVIKKPKEQETQLKIQESQG